MIIFFSVKRDQWPLGCLTCKKPLNVGELLNSMQSCVFIKGSNIIPCHFFVGGDSGFNALWWLTFYFSVCGACVRLHTHACGYPSMYACSFLWCIFFCKILLSAINYLWFPSSQRRELQNQPARSMRIQKTIAASYHKDRFCNFSNQTRQGIPASACHPGTCMFSSASSSSGMHMKIKLSPSPSSEPWLPALSWWLSTE